MKTLLEKYFPARLPENGAGSDSGAAGAGASAGSAGGGAAAGGAGGAAAGGAAGDGNAAAAAGAAAAGAGKAGAEAGASAAAPYRPAGLPDTIYGKDDRETMDNLAKALNGYRTRDSERGVPEKADAYNSFEVDKVDAALKPHLEQLAGDPLYKAVSDVALAEKVPVATMQKLVGTLYAEAQKAGILEPMIDAAAERQALLPDAVKSAPKAQQDAAIDARMQANEDWVKLITKPGADGKPMLDPKVGEHALLMLMDTAAGNRFLEFVRDQMTGAGKAAPIAGAGAGGSGANAREALTARAALPENTHGHPKFDRASWDQLQADYKKLASA
jgi:hypothetical protein